MQIPFSTFSRLAVSKSNLEAAIVLALTYAVRTASLHYQRSPFRGDANTSANVFVLCRCCPVEDTIDHYNQGIDDITVNQAYDSTGQYTE